MRIEESIDYVIIPSKEVQTAIDCSDITRIAQNAILESESQKKDNHQTCGTVTNSVLKAASNTSYGEEGMMLITLFFQDITGSQRIKEEKSFDEGNMMIICSDNKLSFKKNKSAGSLFKKLDLTKTISKEKKLENGELLESLIKKKYNFKPSKSFLNINSNFNLSNNNINNNEN